jgi:hypothetical protein
VPEESQAVRQKCAITGNVSYVYDLARVITERNFLKRLTTGFRVEWLNAFDHMRAGRKVGLRYSKSSDEIFRLFIDSPYYSESAI